MIIWIVLIVAVFAGFFLLNPYLEKKREERMAEKMTNGNPQQTHEQDECAEGGCGLSSVCNKQKNKGDVVYFEDEELDSFKGRKSDSYTEQETEMFDEVLTSLLPNDLAPWLNSLCARDIELPAVLKQKALSMLSAVKKN